MKVCISTHARFGGKSHSFPYREAFDLILMSTLTWITHGEIARGRDKNKGDQFLWSGRENPSNCWRRGEFRITWTLRTLTRESNKFAIAFCIGLLSSFLKSFMFHVTMFVIAQSPEKMNNICLLRWHMRAECRRLGPSVHVVESLTDKLLVHASAIECDLGLWTKTHSRSEFNDFISC